MRVLYAEANTICKILQIICKPKNRIIVNTRLALRAGGRDELNPVSWLATRAGKNSLSCPLGIARFVGAITKEMILILLSMLQAVLRYMGSLYI